MAHQAETGTIALLSTIHPYAVALGYPVTLAELADHLDHLGACRAGSPYASAEEPAFLVASLPEPLRLAIADAGPAMLAFLACKRRTRQASNARGGSAPP